MDASLLSFIVGFILNEYHLLVTPCVFLRNLETWLLPENRDSYPVLQLSLGERKVGLFQFLVLNEAWNEFDYSGEEGVIWLRKPGQTALIDAHLKDIALDVFSPGDERELREHIEEARRLDISAYSGLVATAKNSGPRVVQLLEEFCGTDKIPASTIAALMEQEEGRDALATFATLVLQYVERSVAELGEEERRERAQCN